METEHKAQLESFFPQAWKETCIVKIGNMHLKEMDKGWRDGSVVESTYSFSRGPKFDLLYPHVIVHNPL